MMLAVTGFDNAEVGSVALGTYRQSGFNHEMMAFKKDGAEVHMYYWDRRDGVASNGW